MMGRIPGVIGVALALLVGPIAVSVNARDCRQIGVCGKAQPQVPDRRGNNASVGPARSAVRNANAATAGNAPIASVTSPPAEAALPRCRSGTVLAGAKACQ